MAKFKILTIDGGGIRGIIPIIILERLCKELNVIAGADLLAGTSTGGLISLALAKGLTPGEIKNIYINQGKRIFADSFIDDLTDLFNLTGADYDIKNLEAVLKEVFGNDRLYNLKKLVFVTAFQLDNGSPDKTKRCWEPKLFGNLPTTRYNSRVPVYKAALYTAAAPVYFPVVDGYIDGGVFAVNPSEVALGEALLLEEALENIEILSISTGISRKFIEGKEHNWGYAQWIKPLLSIFIQGACYSVDNVCRNILRDRYCRIDPVFPEGITIDMDDASKIDYMIKFAEQVDLTGAVEWLKKYWV